MRNKATPHGILPLCSLPRCGCTRSPVAVAAAGAQLRLAVSDVLGAGSPAVSLHRGHKVHLMPVQIWTMPREPQLSCTRDISSVWCAY